MQLKIKKTVIFCEKLLSKLLKPLLLRLKQISSIMSSSDVKRWYLIYD